MSSSSSSSTPPLSPEDLAFTPEQQAAYDSAQSHLHESSSTFLALIPKLVSVEAYTPPRSANNNSSNTSSNNNPDEPDDVVTLISPARGHHELFRALDLLDGLEKEEQGLAAQMPLTRQLTALVMTGDDEATTTNDYADSTQALRSLETLGQAVPRRVCQHPFKKNDIVWVCRTCQADETCVLCHACFSQSQHEGHDVAFYHAQAGGCCDCGDPDAWDPAGFCPRHGPNAAVSNDHGAALPPMLVSRVRGVVPSCVDWLVQKVAANAETAYARANPPKPKRIQKMNSERVTDSTTTTAAGGASTPDHHRAPPNRSLSVPGDGMDLEMGDDDDEDDDDDDEIPDDAYPVNAHRAHVFSPTAASSSSTVSADLRQAAARAEALGTTGREGNGLYLVLHADDIHSTQQLLDALRDFLGTSNYYTDTLLSKLVRSLRQYGQLVVWGTMELIQECGATQVHLWMDGDKVAAGRIGAVILERASRLTRHGMFCSILTRDELLLEQRAVAVLQWVSAVARSCDPLCLTVAECILPNRHLVPLLLADFKMSARVTKAWYSLLLTLLAVPTFKSHLAAAYCDTYRAVTAKYARGMGVLERSGYTLSVQFLNRVNYVIDLVQGRDLLGKLGKSLVETLMVAGTTQSTALYGRLNPNHFVLTHRRYSPCISDLKCVLNVQGMPRVIACSGGTFLGDWIASLSLAQFMDPQTWRHWTQGHVEIESRGWVGAFNASISLGSLFERLLGWADKETSPIAEGPLSRDLMSCVELTFHILTNGIDRWQRSERLSYEPTAYESLDWSAFHKNSPASLPFSSVAAKHGSALAMRQLPVSQVSPFSFHLPLHRFVAGCLRELCLREQSEVGGIADLLQRLQTQLPPRQQDELFQGLMEFPALVLSRAAQVRAGLWRRNGPGLNDQVLNYAEPPFCRNMRDADMLMTQFATIGRVQNQSSVSRSTSDIGISFFVNLMLHRLGVFEFVGLAKAPESDVARYSSEVSAGLYPPERGAHKEGDGPFLPWTYSPARESASLMVLLEEFLHFMIIFVSELPPVSPRDNDEQTKQAKFRLLREVIHRLASGPKTHSELSEVHHVLSYWDNVLLSEEGKLVNPDDATGAALGTVLEDIADRKVRRGKMEPDKWEMRRSAWDMYDPAFFHISLRSHQTAADGRPRPPESPTSSFGWEARPYAPVPIAAHPFFERLRRDVTADATTLAVAYRVLHLHCRKNLQKNLAGLRGGAPYESAEKSETALARTIHLLTIGVYAWKDARADDAEWRTRGGGSVGSLFFDKSETDAPPTAASWVKEFLLVEPRTLLDCDWYEGEEKALVLLERLAMSGGIPGGFIAQDSAVRSGAAWLCEFAFNCCPEARSVLSPVKKAAPDSNEAAKTESEAEKRKKMAKQKMEQAMARMKEQAAKFAIANDVDLGSEEESTQNTSQDFSAPSTPVDHSKPFRKTSFGSTHSSASSFGMGDIETGNPPSFIGLPDSSEEFVNAPPRLLQTRPRCIICNDEDSSDTRTFEKSDNNDGESQRKKSRRRAENALGFVGYAQASTVLKGGGGPPLDFDAPLSPVREFVGTHVAQCGHAVHSECCESYLSTVSHREDRQIGKRDEFRCPLCQRLSNCLVPFIDVGADWIDAPTCLSVGEGESSRARSKSEDAMHVDSPEQTSRPPLSLQDFLDQTPWWVARRGSGFDWDGQSAFVEQTTQSAGDEDTVNRKPSRRRIRSLKKKDLYAAWNGMMRTPRFVRRKLRRSSSRTSSAMETDAAAASQSTSSGEESSGETVVWRRFMDQLSDISYRADSKRLGDDHFHDLFGEFRHYIVEKYAYNMANRFSASEPTDWPSCLFTETLSDNRKQEMSREKALSKLLLSIQAFTYSCCSEAFEARREYRRCMSSSSQVASKAQDSTVEAVLSKFGIAGVVCDGRMIVMPQPSAQEGDGAGPFDGRIGRLRYFALTVMAAAGAVVADLVQLVLPFPLEVHVVDAAGMEVENPDRAPIAYPLLFGNVLTHVIAALCATCGRTRARSDSLDVVWQVPFSPRGSFVFSDFSSRSGKAVDALAEDCEGFLKLGLLARILQVLLGKLEIDPSRLANMRPWIVALGNAVRPDAGLPPAEKQWMLSCLKLLEIAVVRKDEDSSAAMDATLTEPPTLKDIRDACALAASAAVSFLSDAGTILQVLVPSIMAKYASSRPSDSTSLVGASNSKTFGGNALEQLLDYFMMEPVDAMLESPLVRDVVANWFGAACSHAKAAKQEDGSEASLRSRLYRTQGFRVFDWPSAGSMDEAFDPLATHGVKDSSSKSSSSKTQETAEHQPQDDVTSSNVELESVPSQSVQASTADIVRTAASPTLLTFNSKKSVSLLGGFSPDMVHSNKGNKNDRPRVLVIPTSYTDLYAELGTLMPDCEQTAVCLICGEVLNAGGKGECTRHSYKCGAGAGMFFLLQECSGLIMHKNKAAYIHSPYLDSHGETPQYRGRPLNLDLDRYEHLREVWFSHGVRQKVVAERVSSRQVILPDFY